MWTSVFTSPRPDPSQNVHEKAKHETFTNARKILHEAYGHEFIIMQNNIKILFPRGNFYECQ